MELLSIIEIWSYIKRFPKWLKKRLFTKERLSDLVLIDVQPRNEPVKANLGKPSSFGIYFQVINMSPFDVELDRAEIDFICSGISLNSQYIKKKVFKAGEVGTLYIAGEIESDRADQIAHHYDNNHSLISFHGEFNCELHNFTKIRQNLSGVFVHFTNAKSRKEEIQNKRLIAEALKKPQSPAPIPESQAQGAHKSS